MFWGLKKARAGFVETGVDVWAINCCTKKLKANDMIAIKEPQYAKYLWVCAISSDQYVDCIEE